MVKLNKAINLTTEDGMFFDLDIKDGDFIMTTGDESLENDIISVIMTRLNELEDYYLYTGFGCRVHQIPKQVNDKMSKYLLEQYLKESVEGMNRVKKVDNISINDSNVTVTVTSIMDNVVKATVNNKGFNYG